MDNIFKGYSKPTIYKLIVKHSNTKDENGEYDDITKYIFVGNRNKGVKKILARIQNNGYDILTTSDKKILNNEFGIFKKIFDKIIIGRTKFIYHFIDNNENIKHLMDKLCITLGDSEFGDTEQKYYKFLPYKQYLYTYNTKISYNYYVSMINFIFEDKKIINKRKFINKLSKILMLDNEEKIKERLVELDSNRYSSVNKINLFKLDEYNYDIILANDDIKNLLSNNIQCLNNYWIKSNNLNVVYFNNQDPYKYIEKKIDIHRDEFVKMNDKNLEQVLNNFGRFIKNTLYLILYDDVKDKLNDDGKIYYFGNNEKKKDKEEYEKIQENIDIRLITRFNYGSELIDKYTINDKKYEKFIFKLNSTNKYIDINLENIFNKYSLNNIIPIIEYVSNKTLYKVYKPFIINKNLINIIDLIKYNDTIINNITLERDYLRFICWKDTNSVLFFYLMDDGEFIVYNKNLNFVDITKTKYVINLTNVLIKSINKIVNIKSLTHINIKNLYNIKFINLSNDKLIYSNISFKFKLKRSIDKLYEKMLDNIKKCNYYFTLTKNPINPNITFIFKHIDNFFSKENIERFISSRLKKYKDFKDKKIRDDISDEISNLFSLNIDDANRFIKDFNLTNKIEESIIGITITLDIVNNSTIKIMMEDLDSFNYSHKIIQILSIIISNIIDGNNNYVISKDSKKISSLIEIDEIIEDEDFDNDFGEFIDDSLLRDFNIEEIEEEIMKEDLKKKDNKVQDDIVIKKKGRKLKELKYTQYMNVMRERADKELFDKDKDYSSKCQSNVMKKPYIVSKSELDTFDPKSITGYMKYRGNYYICPRLWDAIANKPISVDAFIKNGYKSPYSQGKIIDDKSKQKITNEFSVIVRRPESKDKLDWADPEKEKKWGEELARSGKDAFPGFTKSLVSKDPKLCRPCCFSTVLEEYDPNSDTIQNFKKVVNSNICSVDTDKGEYDTELMSDIPTNENYIKNAGAVLDENRIGLLPENLDILLNNHQEIFLHKNKNQLLGNVNLFLRKGVKKSINSNFLNVIANLKNIPIQRFRQLIVEYITPDLFITLNNGDLVRIYSSNDILPHHISNERVSKFVKFLLYNSKLYTIFNLSKDNVEKISNLLYKEKKTNKDLKTIKKFSILYKIFTSYYNFKKNILNNNVSYIDYRHFLDLFSRYGNIIFPQGINIIIFNKEINKLECNPYMNATKKMMFLIKDSNKYFTPIVHVKIVNKVLKLNGVIDITNNQTNISSELENYLHKMKVNKAIINFTKNREKYLTAIYKLHEIYCNKQLKYISNLSDYDLIINEFKIMGVVITNSIKSQYLLLENDILIPIMPMNITYDYTVFLLTEVSLENDFSKVWKYYEEFNNKFKRFNYKVDILLVNNDNELVGLKFKNSLIVPIKKQNMNSKFISQLIEDGIKIENMELYVDFLDLNLKENIQINQLLYQDYLYQHFKYEFSNFVNENKFLKVKYKIIELLNSDELYLGNYKSKLHDMIIELMSKLMPKRLRNNVEVIPGVKIGKCYKSLKKQCSNNPFCADEDNKCFLNMNSDMLDIFTSLLIQDMMVSKENKHQIMNNQYIPIFISSDKIFNSLNEEIINEKDLTRDLEIIKLSKYRKNLNVQYYTNLRKMSYIINKKDINSLEKINYNEFLKYLDKITTLLTSHTLDYILQDNILIATHFDDKGVRNVKYEAGPCIFPYLDVSNYKLKYNCIYNKKKLLTCPTEVDYDKKPLSWGYCPEDPVITKKRMNILPIDASGDKSKGFLSGKCQFPYMIDDYKLIYSCQNEKDDKDNVYSWCPTRLKKGDVENNYIPIASKNQTEVMKTKWKYKDIYIKKSKKIDPNFLKAKKKGYCNPPIRKSKKNLIHKDEEIEFDNYNSMLCGIVPSKGGYKREQLYIFGLSMGISWKEMKKSDGETLLPKDELCEIINKKYKEIKKSYEKDMKGECIYPLDINKCYLGEKRGGLKLQKLREIAIDKCGLTLNEIKDMSKIELCDFFKEKMKIIDDDTIEIPKQINLDNCINKSPNRGGYSLAFLKKLANILNINSNAPKKTLCEEINNKLTMLSNENYNNNNDDDEESLNTIKLEKITSLNNNTVRKRTKKRKTTKYTFLQ